MDWLNLSAEAGLWGLFAGSFLSATLLPGGSEALLFAFLRLHPEERDAALLLATLGNTAGGMTSWACGRWLPAWRRLDSLPHLDTMRRHGTAALLLSWVPLIGDALCVAAGWLRINPWSSLLFMALGKFARYWLIAHSGLI